jgi:hypothetical protein
MMANIAVERDAQAGIARSLRARTLNVKTIFQATGMERSQSRLRV